MRVSSPPSAFQFLPISVRLMLAKMTLWRMRHGSALMPMVLTLGVVLLSGSVGYLAALQRHVGLVLNTDSIANISPPPTGAAQPLNSGAINRGDFPNASDWGLLHAELLRLRVLLKRIADLSDFNGGEFDLDVDMRDLASINQDRFQKLLQPNATVSHLMLAKSEVSHMSQNAGLMLSIVENRLQDNKQRVSGRPVNAGAITSRFGYRRDPLSGLRQFHRGMDFAGKPDTRVVALADGVVTYSGKNGGYGNWVELEHADGYRSRYAHNSANLVFVGARVGKGEPIALMGSTGKSTGTHVHVEIHKDGRSVDPVTYLR